MQVENNASKMNDELSIYFTKNIFQHDLLVNVIQQWILIIEVEHYSMKISDQNLAHNYKSNYKLTNPTSYEINLESIR